MSNESKNVNMFGNLDLDKNIIFIDVESVERITSSLLF